MESGYTVTSTNFLGSSELETVIVFNYHFINEVHHHITFFIPKKETYGKDSSDCVGYWKIKQLKN